MSNIYDKASLVLIPSGTKTSKVYSQKPTNGDGDFTFSRSTAATRVNASGNIEKETQNLLVQSNSFNTTWFFNGFPTLTGGQSGYDGSSDAWSLAGTGIQYASVRQTIALSEVVTLSVYAKAGTQDFLAMNTGSSLTAAWFDLSNGTLGSTDTNVIDSAIESIGGGWYRCSMSIVGISEFRIYVTDADNNFGTAIGNIYIQDAQLEQGLVARDYIETTTTAIYGGITDNVPRLDYTDSSCPALLLEPQRTNLVPYSEYFGASNWNKLAVNLTANNTESPEGNQNAYLFVPTSSGGQIYDSIGKSASSIKYTASVFVKAKELTSLRMYVHGTSNANRGDATFNLATESATYSNFGTFTETFADVEDYGNDWYRCVLTTKTDTSLGLQLVIRYDGATNSTDGLYVYGAQLEDNGAGGDASYATSYIPTYGSAVTRNEDVFKVSDVGTNNLITNDAFTLFVDIASVQDSVNSFRDLVAIFGSKNFRIETRTNGQVRAQQIGMVTSGDDFNSVTIGTYSNTKFAFTFTTTQCKIYVDGALHSTYNGAYTHDFNVLSVRNSSSLGAELKNEYRKVMLFPTALSEQEAIDLTTI